MFLDVKHTKLEVFCASEKFVLECYKITKSFPPDERFAMTSQIRRAALSVHLNIAEGSFRKSQSERCRFYEISRGSLIEVDTALDIAVALDYVNFQTLEFLGGHLIQTFKLLSGLISNTATQH